MLVTQGIHRLQEILESIFVDCCSEMGETSDELCSNNKW